MAGIGATAAIRKRSRGARYLAHTGPCRCLCDRAENAPFRPFVDANRVRERGDGADLQFPAAEGKHIGKYERSRGPVAGANANRPQPLYAAFFGSRRSPE